MTLSELRPQRVVQISDSHLFASQQGKLLGLNTDESLRLVLEKVRAEQPHIDAILATGDLSQDGSTAAYQRFHELLSEFEAPSFWLQGNHDITAPMLSTLGARSHLSPCVVKSADWHIIMLNSAVEHEVPGYFQDTELAFLKESLHASRDKHVMICLHHHPVAMGCEWLDNQVVRNAESFWQVVDQFDHVRVIIWGHVHQESDQIRNGVRLLSVPSTCVQFKPFSVDFEVDDLSPGYRWFDLWADGRIDTGVSRVEGVAFEIDFSVKGY